MQIQDMCFSNLFEYVLLLSLVMVQGHRSTDALNLSSLIWLKIFGCTVFQYHPIPLTVTQHVCFVSHSSWVCCEF